MVSRTVSPRFYACPHSLKGAVAPTWGSNVWPEQWWARSVRPGLHAPRMLTVPRSSLEAVQLGAESNSTKIVERMHGAVTRELASSSWECVTNPLFSTIALRRMTDEAVPTRAPTTNHSSSEQPRLAPIENPSSWWTRLGYALCRWEMGTVITPMKVVWSRMPGGLRLLYEINKHEERLSLDPELRLLVKNSLPL